MKISGLELRDRPLLLAPMEDVTDPSFRYICKLFGADMMFTEFISSDGLIRDGKKSLVKLDISDDERPIGIQLYGHIPEAMVEAAKIAAGAKPDVIDINYGCPVRKIATRGAGAGMLCNIPMMVEMTSAIVNAVNLPVTVKTRLGWDENSKNIVDIAERLQDTGIKAITIHGRTRAQLYKGTADWTLIGAVKNNPRMKIPVIGNGDIVSPAAAREAFDKYGVDGIMIGRGAIGRPWIFKEIRHYLDNGEEMEPLTVKEKTELARLHLKKSLEIKGEPRGIYEMRRHYCHYFKGLPDFKELRMKLVTINEPEQIFSLLDEINNRYDF
ncbi:MAG: tRNA dihydrouridine synthase DusB [Bacteroidales bacterium]|nr:tRNA dihydrouridine synthase DusB [Bacteroidales bacterium]